MAAITENADAASPVEGLLTEPDAAEVCGVALSVLQGLRHKGVGPKFVVIGKTRIRYRPAALRAWLEEREVASMAEFYVLNAERAQVAAKQRRAAALARETRHRAPKIAQRLDKPARAKPAGATAGPSA